jgi:mannose-6-phosphate isomerase-like protein (cupin superfamily)
MAISPEPPKIVSSKFAEHYKWGMPHADCEGWHLVKTPGLSVIEERMPPGASETAHAHSQARQFFFVLEGELTLLVEGHDLILQAGNGLEIAPGRPHQALNRGSRPVRMLVISQPPSHGDRTMLDASEF